MACWQTLSLSKGRPIPRRRSQQDSIFQKCRVGRERLGGVRNQLGLRSRGNRLRHRSRGTSPSQEPTLPRGRSPAWRGTTTVVSTNLPKKSDFRRSYRNRYRASAPGNSEFSGLERNGESRFYKSAENVGLPPKIPKSLSRFRSGKLGGFGIGKERRQSFLQIRRESRTYTEAIEIAIALPLPEVRKSPAWRGTARAVSTIPPRKSDFLTRKGFPAKRAARLPAAIRARSCDQTTKPLEFSRGSVLRTVGCRTRLPRGSSEGLWRTQPCW